MLTGQGTWLGLQAMPRGLETIYSTRNGKAHLLIPGHEVHEALVVVVVVSRLRSVGGQQQVVGAQPVALCVCVGEDAGLQQLVV